MCKNNYAVEKRLMRESGWVLQKKSGVSQKGPTDIFCFIWSLVIGMVMVFGFGDNLNEEDSVFGFNLLLKEKSRNLMVSLGPILHSFTSLFALHQSLSHTHLLSHLYFTTKQSPSPSYINTYISIRNL